MDIPQPRAGTFVTLRGREYRAAWQPIDGTVWIITAASYSPAAESFDEDSRLERQVANVATADCDQMVSVRTRAYWAGHLYAVAAITDDGEASLRPLGDNRSKTAVGGARIIKPADFAYKVPIVELSNYHEIHSDLLFEEWRRTVFPGTTGIRETGWGG